MKSGNRKLLDQAAIGLFLLFFVVTYADVLFKGAGFHQRDLTTYHYPMKKIVRESFLRGELPLWNPYYSAGQPMAANPAYEVFYPPQLLVLLPSYNFGYQLHILLHLLIGGLGMYLLVRSLEGHPFAALFAAVAFAFGGPLLSLVRLLPFLFAVSWIPLILFFVRRLLREGGGRNFAGAAISLGMQALVGEPVTLLQTWSLIALYAVFLAWHRRHEKRALLRLLATTVAVLATGVAIAAVQLIPAADHAAASVRSQPFNFSLVSHWSMPWARPLEIFFPAVFRSLRDAAGEVPLMSMYDFGDPFIGDFYFGLLPALLVVAALFVRRRHTLPYAAVIAGAFLVALGKNTPLLAFLFKAGIFRSIRYPEKFALPALILLIVAAALLFDRLLARDRKVLTAVTVLAALWGVVALIGLAGASPVTPPQPVDMIDWTVIGEKAISERAWWMIQLGRGVVLLALLVWLKKSKGETSVWAATTALLLLVDLRFLQGELARRMPSAFFTPPEIARQLPDHGARLFHQADWEWADSSSVSQQYFSDGRSQPWLIRNGLFPRTAAAWGIPLVMEEDFDQTQLLPTAQLLQSMKDVRSRGVAEWNVMFESMSGAGYRATFRDFDSEMQRVSGDRERLVPVDVESVGPNPRYYFASQLLPIRHREDFVYQLSQRNWTPGTVYVEGATFPVAPGTVVRAEEKAAEISLQVEAEGRSFLAVSITPHKYWSATIDGKPATLRVANIGFQGIEVPEGKHSVVLRYGNPLIAVGAVLSVIALIVAFGAAFVWKPPRP